MPRRCAAYGCTNNWKRNKVVLYAFPKDAYYRKIWTHIVRLNWKNSNWIATPSSSLCSEHFEKTSKNFYEAQIKNERLKLPRLKPTAIPTIFGDTRMRVERLVPEVENQERQQHAERKLHKEEDSGWENTLPEMHAECKLHKEEDSGWENTHPEMSNEVSATWGIIIPKSAFDSLCLQSSSSSCETSVETKIEPKMCVKDASLFSTTLIPFFNIKSEPEIYKKESLCDISTSADCAEFNVSSCFIKEEPKEVLNDDDVNITSQELKDFRTEANDTSFSSDIWGIKQEYVQPEESYYENGSPVSFILPERIPSPFETANTETNFKIDIMNNIEVSMDDNVSVSDSTAGNAMLNYPCDAVPTIKSEFQESEVNNCLPISEVTNNLGFMKPESELHSVSLSNENCNGRYCLRSKKSRMHTNKVVVKNKSKHIS